MSTKIKAFLKRIEQDDSSVFLDGSVCVETLERLYFIAKKKMTLFEFACSKNALQIVRTLLSKNDKGHYLYPEIATKFANDHNDALALAAENGHIAIVDRLLAKNENGRYEFAKVARWIPKSSHSFFHAAVNKGFLQVIERFLFKNENGSYEFPSITASISGHAILSGGHLPVLNRFLAKDAEGNYEFPALVNAIGKNLCSALRDGHLAILERLIARKADNNYEFPQVIRELTDNSKAIMVAAVVSGNLLLVKRLMASMPDGSYEFPELITATAIENFEILNLADLKKDKSLLYFLLSLQEVFAGAIVKPPSYLYPFYLQAFVERYLDKLGERNKLDSINFTEKEAAFARLVLAYLEKRLDPDAVLKPKKSKDTQRQLATIEFLKSLISTKPCPTDRLAQKFYFFHPAQGKEVIQASSITNLLRA